MKRGLTLGEMLVVLLVFSILAVMLFFSSNLAITKTKLARVSQDQKQLVQALAAYSIEYNFAVPSETQGLYAVSHSSTSFFTVPLDPFTQGRGAKEYEYYTELSPSFRCLLVSVGPDGESDVKDSLEQIKYRNMGRAAMWAIGRYRQKRPVMMSDQEARDFIMSNSYDPTNGAFSKGDIIRIYTQ